MGDKIPGIVFKIPYPLFSMIAPEREGEMWPNIQQKNWAHTYFVCAPIPFFLVRVSNKPGGRWHSMLPQEVIWSTIHLQEAMLHNTHHTISSEKYVYFWEVSCIYIFFYAYLSSPPSPSLATPNLMIT